MQHGSICNFCKYFKNVEKQWYLWAGGNPALSVYKIPGRQLLVSIACGVNKHGGRFSWVVVKEPSNVWDSYIEKGFLLHTEQWKIVRPLPVTMHEILEKGFSPQAQIVNGIMPHLHFSVYKMCLYYLIFKVHRTAP